MFVDWRPSLWASKETVYPLYTLDLSTCSETAQQHPMGYSSYLGTSAFRSVIILVGNLIIKCRGCRHGKQRWCRKSCHRADPSSSRRYHAGWIGGRHSCRFLGRRGQTLGVTHKRTCNDESSTHFCTSTTMALWEWVSTTTSSFVLMWNETLLHKNFLVDSERVFTSSLTVSLQKQ